MSICNCCTINKPHVISEVVDGEAIIVNLESGAYFSLRGTGGTIWNLIEQGFGLDDIQKQFVEQYDGDPATMQTAVVQLIDELEAEKLVTVQPVNNGLPCHREANHPEEKRQPFEKPVLDKYTDMADLLLLDPIHDVDESGWPHTPGNLQPDHLA